MVPDFEVKAGDRWFHQCVGIDIAKEKFDACLFMYDTGNDMGCCTQSVQFPNNKTGFNQLVKWSRKEALKDFPLTFLMEPTGVYYEPVAYHLHKVGMTVYVVLPNKARHFAEYLGIKTKTDEMDARCLALLGCANQRLQPWTPPIPIYRELRQLCRFAADMNKLRTMLNNHLEALQHSECPEPSVVKHYKSMIDVVDRKLEKNEATILSKVDSDKNLAEKVKRIATIKGVGIQTIVTVIAETNGFALIRNRKQLTSYAGLDVIASQSGDKDPKHKLSKKGNSRIRAALYMPAITAIRWNPQIHEAYGRIVDKNPGVKMIGVAAAMRRLLLLIYSLWNNNETYDPNRKQ